MNTQDQPYQRGLAIKALQWVYCAFKPLSIEDLAQAVALDSDGNTDTVVTGSFLLQICGSFIIVTNAGSVRFAHRSVKEYLTHSGLTDSGGWKFSLSNAHAQVAETCLSFLLSFEDASKWATLPTNFHEEALGLRLTGFEMYACFFWASHCKNATSDGSWKPNGSWKRFEYLFDKFFSVRSDGIRGKVKVACTAFQKWISLLWRVFQTDSNLEDSMRHRLEDAISDPPTPLFAACIWGFDFEALRLTMRGGRIVNPNNYRGKSCLYLACENGHVKIVDSLIRSPAIVDAGHKRWGSCLHAAASSGMLTCFVKMLECGARVNTPEGFYGRTIDAAIRGGNPAIVTHALRVGAVVWLPSTDAPVRPRKGRSGTAPSTEISSSDTLSDEDSVLSDLGQDLLYPIGVTSFSNKDSTPPGCYDLLDRLHKASLRRRELLNFWRLAKNIAVVDHRFSDELAILEEASGSLTESRQEVWVLHPRPREDGSSLRTQCYYCFQTIDSTDINFHWR